MVQRHVIEVALDLARMPSLARSSGAPALPPNILELIRIAAACPEACEAAVAETGEPTAVLIEAARFYLQHVLFRSEADSYRILGVNPSTSRATARHHMRWLLEWLHPDRNNDSLDAVYAERVLKAWREVSASHGPAAKRNASCSAMPCDNKKRTVGVVRVPWIAHTVKRRQWIMRNSFGKLILWGIPASLLIAYLGWWSANALLGP